MNPGGRALVLLALVVLAAALLAGCTPRETKGQYETKVTAVYQLRERTIAGMQSNGSGDASYFTRAKAQIDDAVRQLEAISPPRDVEQAHTRYIASLQAMSSVLGEFAHCATVQQHSAAQGTQCRADIPQSGLDSAQNDFQNAVQIYRAAGYDLPQVQGAQ